MTSIQQWLCEALNCKQDIKYNYILKFKGETTGERKKNDAKPNEKLGFEVRSISVNI